MTTAAELARVSTDHEWYQIEEHLLDDIAFVTYSVAKQVLAEEQARGFDSEPVVVTDRVYGKPPILVNPFGRIDFYSRENVSEIIEWIFRQLVMRSPIDTGRYSESHIILVNGVQYGSGAGRTGPFAGRTFARAARSRWEQGAFDSKRLGPNDRVQIVNTQPYARRIERGWSQMTPNGVYKVVAGMAQRRFGKLAFIDYKFVKLNLGVRVWGYAGGGRARRRVLRPQVYPAIQIKPSAGTITGE